MDDVDTEPTSDARVCFVGQCQKERSGRPSDGVWTPNLDLQPADIQKPQQLPSSPKVHKLEQTPTVYNSPQGRRIEREPSQGGQGEHEHAEMASPSDVASLSRKSIDVPEEAKKQAGGNFSIDLHAISAGRAQTTGYTYSCGAAQPPGPPFAVQPDETYPHTRRGGIISSLNMLPCKQILRHAKSTRRTDTPPWRPSGSEKQRCVARSVHTPRRERIMRKTRSAGRAQGAATSMTMTTAPLPAPPTKITSEVPKLKPSTCQPSDHGCEPPGTRWILPETLVASPATCTPNNSRAWSLPPRPHKSSSVIFPMASTLDHPVPRARSRSAPCAWTGLASPTSCYDVRHGNAGTDAPPAYNAADADAAPTCMASQEPKAAGVVGSVLLLPGSRAAMNKRWGKADFVAARRLGFRLQAVLESHVTSTYASDLHTEVYNSA